MCDLEPDCLGLYLNSATYSLYDHDAERSASLYAGAKLNLRDRVLSEVEKESFITSPGKGSHSGILPQKALFPNLEGLVRSFIGIVQRGRDQHILLMGCWRGKQESESSAFRFQLVWGLHACGQHTIVNR